MLAPLPQGHANPLGGTVAQGKASFSSQGPHLTIQTSDRAFINWQSFNIWPGETTSFVQPSSSSLVWNQIHDQNPSQILGNLNANGYVVLQNASGFYIGGQASISAHGLLMTTAPLALPDLSSGGAWSFNAPPPTASIINYGQINASGGGSVFLLAHEVQNQGNIAAPEGHIGLYAGKQVLISDRPDGRGLSAKVTLPDGSVDNSGKLVADAGTIEMHAQVVNQGGLVQANSVRNVNGTIELVASDAVNLEPNSVLQASGDSQGFSPGGAIVIKSAKSFADQPGSTIEVAGGSQGGNGGQVEISASQMSAIHSEIAGRAAEGFTSGKLFIDPANILLSDQGDSAPGSGIIHPGDPPSAGSPDTLTLNVNSFNNLISQGALSQISLQATKNIEVNTLWNLPASQDPKASLTLTAGGNITLDDGAGINAGKNWSINMSAGPTGLAARPAAGTDSIQLNGRAYIQAQNGDLNLWAANDVTVAAGSSITVGNNGIRTLDGGNISVTAQLGDVNTGSNPQGFRYTSFAPFYTVSQNLGGISTAAGGNVSITAGGNVTSFLPFGSGSSATGDAGSGAFGPEPGDVTISAGGSVFGHYVVANGTGEIEARQNVGGAVASQNAALSLVKGSWDVHAGGNIYLQEVRNPNGVFNSAGRLGSAGNHWFDYDPSAAVNLNAGDAVYLTGLNLPRGGDPVQAIFPPTLDITAGSGGIVLGDTVTLFPSAHGGLNLTTTAGGTLVGNPNNPALTPTPELLMSDSGHTHWTGPGDFGDTDHAAVPPELNNLNPVVLNVSGDMNNLILSTAKATTIKVGGDMIGCSFSGQNLRASDVTSLDVAGRLFNRSPYSFVVLPQALPALPTADIPPNGTLSWATLLTAALDPAKLATLQVPSSIDPSKWAAYAATYAALLPSNPGFVYNATTRRLGFEGQMSEAVRTGLEQPLTVLRYGPDGLPILDSSGHFVTDKVGWASASAIEQLYQASLGAPSASSPAQLGYRLGGPGQFNVHAGSISLGNTYGILSCGTGDPTGGQRYGDLASLTPAGATVNVNVDGDLDMITSAIAALGGGDVNLSSAKGSLDLGSQELFSTSRGVALGVYTSGRGNVNVSALGDINIDGSRIAAYNGGNISVTSLEGNVNAGSGGTTFVSVYSYYVDPVTGQPGAYQELVFGSGIVANTLVKPGQVPGSATRPGNIAVQTPQGNILASLGGIVQEALNGDVSSGPTITLVAGTAPSATSPGHKGNIDLGDSGVIGGTVNAQANGNITGLVISRQNATINAAQSFSGTVLSGGTASLAAGGTISGTVIGVGGVNASGGQGISASLLGQNVSIGGGAAQSTLGTAAPATSTSQAAAAQTSNDTRDKLAATDNPDDDEKKKRALPVLARKTGRVTVILPPAN